MRNAQCTINGAKLQIIFEKSRTAGKLFWGMKFLSHFQKTRFCKADYYFDEADLTATIIFG